MIGKEELRGKGKFVDEQQKDADARCCVET